MYIIGCGATKSRFPASDGQTIDLVEHEGPRRLLDAKMWIFWNLQAVRTTECARSIRPSTRAL